jgi:hypothetical protein
MADTASPYAVMCYTCHVVVWKGDSPLADGQAELTRYAESTPGTACPSKVDPCPHKTAALAAAALLRPATLGDLASVKKRLDTLESRMPAGKP